MTEGNLGLRMVKRVGLLLAVLAVVTFIGPAVARAANAAEKTALAAKAAYDKGSFEEAARLFYQAWQLQPNEGGWLYSSARSCHKAGNWDDAAARYEIFIKNPKGSPEKAAQAQQHLADVQNERVKALLRRAMQAPDPALGFRHALAASKLLPDDLQVWLLAAELADKANLVPEALTAYRQVLRLAGPQSPEAQAASRRLVALGAPPLADSELQAQQAAQARERGEVLAREQAAQREIELKAQRETELKAQRESELKAQREAELKAQREKVATAEQEKTHAVERQRRERELAARQQADRERMDALKPSDDPSKRPGVGKSKMPQYDLSGADGPGFAWGPLLSVVSGAAAVGVGGYRLQQALVAEKALRADTWGVLDRDPKALVTVGYLDAQGRATAIGNEKAIGWTVAGVGGAALLGGAIWWLVRDSGPRPLVTVSAAPAVGGGLVVVWAPW